MTSRKAQGGLEDRRTIHSIGPSLRSKHRSFSRGPTTGGPTIWGLTPRDVYERFWASRGVQVVRPGEPAAMIDGPVLFLLLPSPYLVTFGASPDLLVGQLKRRRIRFLLVHDERSKAYRERAVADSSGRLVRYERVYGGRGSAPILIAVTTDPVLAILWQEARDGWPALMSLRAGVPRLHQETLSADGRVYDGQSSADLVELVHEIAEIWADPRVGVRRARKLDGSVWADREARVHGTVHSVGPAWIGAGRAVEKDATILGPAVLWDAASARPCLEPPPERRGRLPARPAGRRGRPEGPSRFEEKCKRIFDVVFSTLALVLTLPLYPWIMLGILLEDGWPPFYAQRRETVGGRQFSCLKFRSMRKDADQVKAALRSENRSDGPQFHLLDDPRTLRIGTFLRKTKLDELPQFINVILGDMSVVGPRPSPFDENQYCPAWREARLSVRPGITGLWQVSRTRRAGLDFQEWIKYDTHYVEHWSWRLDLRILLQTVAVVLRGR